MATHTREMRTNARCGQKYKSPPYSQTTRIYSTDAQTGEVTFVTVDVAPTQDMCWNVRAKYHSAEEKPGSLRNVLRFHTRADALAYGAKISYGLIKRDHVETLQRVFDYGLTCDIWDEERRRIEREAWERGSRPTTLQRTAAALAAHPDVIG